jgi:methylated-DNA-[protein]-cysteine S-methyltransferase
VIIETTFPMKKKITIHATHHESPLGRMLLLATDEGLCGAYFEGQRYFPDTDAEWEWNARPFLKARRQLDEYYKGRRNEFDLSLDLRGTEFQKRVWSALLAISRGETRSYREIAIVTGSAAAVRAVGVAIGRNPVSVIVPCHRVIGSGGSLTGYAGGLHRKEWLLKHEGALQ